MQTRFLLGPSGTGKTFRCLAEVRSALLASPDGLPLLFLAPKQATFQLERQLLSSPDLPGYTRLQILSFERLAQFILSELGAAPPALLSEEGRLMVLRALLTRMRADLQVFHATARLRGFAQELSAVFRELFHAQISVARLRELAEKVGPANRLDAKMHDLATLLQAYLDWLDQHRLQDRDRLLIVATERIRQAQRPTIRGGEASLAGPRNPSTDVRRDDGAGIGGRSFRLGGLWLDGFAELSAQEIDLLVTLLPLCDRATIAFNLDHQTVGPASWQDTWSWIARTFQQVRQRLEGRPEIEIIVEWIERGQAWHRFAQNAALRHLEAHWSQSKRLESARNGSAPDRSTPPVSGNIRLVACPNREAEVTFAAREIRRFLRSGGRCREVAVLARTLEPYYAALRRAFVAYDVPFFLDRREPVGHHPLAELTRSALRTLALHWQTHDWFGALKTGLVHDNEAEIDRLENEALARGWKGKAWDEPLQTPDDPELEKWGEALRKRAMAPFQELRSALGPNPSGEVLAESLLAFWRRLRVGDQLERWTTESANAVHTTFWEQMQSWVKNIALAFSGESLPLRDWLPIVEAGLAGQTVGVIPPALDQVLIGAVDRSRHTHLRLAIVLGLNESDFPAPPPAPTLLSESDRERLAEMQIILGLPAHSRLGQERYFGYVACTRASDRLVLTYSSRDENDQALAPSSFITDLQRIFPDLQTEFPAPLWSCAEADHANDLVAPILQACSNAAQRAQAFQPFLDVPAFARLVERIEQFRSTGPVERVSPALAEALYSKTLASSVSRLEHFAACPFRFFISSGLRAEERKHFELDAREQGSFQHEVMAAFHRTLMTEGKRWRDLTPKEARERIAKEASNLSKGYRSGLLMADDRSLFATRIMTLLLQEFVEVVTTWMEQYEFDPQEVELGFGQQGDPLPAWKLHLDERHELLFRGKIDRVDLWRIAGSKEALCVVVDYKSSAKKLDSTLMAHGIQLQLAAYLNVLRGLPEAAALFGLERLIPAGVFYVNLRGRHETGGTRRKVIRDATDARKLAFKHSGRFDAAVVRQLDRRPVQKGDQFNYAFNQNGALSLGSREALDDIAFREMLDAVEKSLLQAGRAIFSGTADVNPYRKGQVSACDQCLYQGICRIDPWTHAYRTLRK